jgi:predicted metalloendopeptidase
VPLDDWKTYLRWHVLNALSSSLSTPFVDESFAFNGRTLQGTPEQQPLWKRAVSATDRMLGDALGQAYVKQYFPPESKRRMQELVNNLKAALRDDIKTLDWMSEPTRKQALAKLDAFVDKIGYPDKWRDYSTLEVERGPYVTNVLRARQYQLRDQMDRVDKPVDRTRWGYSPATVNASYNPFNNDLTFPAGILQPPFFNPDADDAINYGAIGAVIGHEMTHGFDDEGSQFDADGNLKNWWTEEDQKRFHERTECVVNQFDSYTIDGGVHLKGKLVTGESVADLGGLKIAWKAYQKSLEGKPRPADIDGYTPEQRFFLGYAQVWAGTARPQFELLQTNTNPHPLPRFRLNGTVSNMPEFFKAFGCDTGTGMVRDEKVRCQIW